MDDGAELPSGVKPQHCVMLAAATPPESCELALSSQTGNTLHLQRKTSGEKKKSKHPFLGCKTAKL